MKQLLARIDGFFKSIDIISRIITLIFGILLAINVSSYWLASPALFAVKIRENFVWIWLSILTILVFRTLQLVYDLRKKFVEGYSIDLHGDPGHVWESRDGRLYRTNEKSELIVTNSFEGCITRVGRFWENYDLSFEAMIINQCIGVIYRAESINHYYMFQINHDSIVPHMKSLFPVGNGEITQIDDNTLQVSMPNYKMLWRYGERRPFHIDRNKWFNVKISIRGDNAALYINGEFVCNETLLQIPAGKIGFRNDGLEEALVRNIRVTIRPYK